MLNPTDNWGSVGFSTSRQIAIEHGSTDDKGVPASTIDRKWPGNYGPVIDPAVANRYQINSMNNRYRQIDQAAKSFLDGRNVQYGIHRSVAIFLYKDSDIHIEVSPVE